GMQILQTQQFAPSRGSQQWLGDGVYFWTEVIEAYRWIRSPWEREIRKKKLDPAQFRLIDHYCILQAKVSTAHARVFDLTTQKHRTAFDRMLQLMKEKVKRGRLGDKEVAETVVLNHMFQRLKFSEDYDLVLMSFPRQFHKYADFVTRIGFIWQCQICVKNTAIIADIAEYPLSTALHELEEQAALYTAVV
ncbi:MAG TPA: hypothetical protein VGL77_09855, partial [Armatimonadota bacterium]